MEAGAGEGEGEKERGGEGDERLCDVHVVRRACTSVCLDQTKEPTKGPQSHKSSLTTQHANHRQQHTHLTSRKRASGGPDPRFSIQDSCAVAQLQSKGSTNHSSVSCALRLPRGCMAHEARRWL